jgi:hypothetical protein
MAGQPTPPPHRSAGPMASNPGPGPGPLPRAALGGVHETVPPIHPSMRPLPMASCHLVRKPRQMECTRLGIDRGSPRGIDAILDLGGRHRVGRYSRAGT